jgi:hypothetical protein
MLAPMAAAIPLGNDLTQRAQNRSRRESLRMFKFTESVRIEASLDRTWAYLVDVENWWTPSNPEHETLEILGQDKTLGVGTRIRIREKIAGIPGEAIGEVTEYATRERVTWKADTARYRLWGIPLEVSEGVSWHLRPLETGIELSATVWAIFPAGLKGRCIEWLFKGPIQGEAKDRLHARRELEYIKQELESAV